LIDLSAHVFDLGQRRSRENCETLVS